MHVFIGGYRLYSSGAADKTRGLRGHAQLRVPRVVHGSSIEEALARVVNGCNWVTGS